jgi:hypothetical protein
MTCVTVLNCPAFPAPEMRVPEGRIYAAPVGDPFARVTKFSRKIATTFRHIRDKKARCKTEALNFICAALDWNVAARQRCQQQIYRRTTAINPRR